MASKKKQKKEPVKKSATAETTTASATAPTDQTGTDLSISDLKNISTIIDVASTRGAFRANEMATVGVMFNKLSAFLAKVAPEQKTEGTQDAQRPATETANMGK